LSGKHRDLFECCSNSVVTHHWFVYLRCGFRTRGVVPSKHEQTNMIWISFAYFATPLYAPTGVIQLSKSKDLWSSKMLLYRQWQPESRSPRPTPWCDNTDRDSMGWSAFDF
jgi:hypothetical protein